MKSATIAELRNHLSAYLQRVQAGERLLIRRRGEVIAELRPASASSQAVDVGEALEGRLAALERSGFLARGSNHWPEWSRNPPQGEAAPLLQALLDERENGR